MKMGQKFVEQSWEEGSEGTGKGPDDKGSKGMTVHHVPFKVEYEGPANVDLKFARKSCSGESNVLTNQFRGRPLHGQEVQLPENFEGVVAAQLRGLAGENMDSSSPSEGAPIGLGQRFDSMTYWNWDKAPSGMDKHIKLLDWLELSEILHGPIKSASDDK